VRNKSILLFYFVLMGCISQVATFKDHIASWVGHPISEYLEADALPHTSEENYVGTRQIIRLESGNIMYEFPYRKCPVYFEVDSRGIIVEISTEENKACY